MTTEYDTTKLIAEARKALPKYGYSTAYLIERLADALEAEHGRIASSAYMQRIVAEKNAVIAELEAALPRGVTTVEELDALPVGSVVRDRDREVWVKFEDEWTMVGCNDSDVWAYLPVTLLFAPSVTPGGEEQGDES
ncbi:hypothetical protein [Subtercola endophyticus]|uniref:hypothetical protein n=1 Tax=Subtercola endophyticus TaxID=2895559 RepID=UPI001E350A34|nr:hypothetical protein [Subtercola endophyticus]UFS59493.1 hypothetical protein LQ955_01440 [Subtercola endophyticus]